MFYSSRLVLLAAVLTLAACARSGEPAPIVRAVGGGEVSAATPSAATPRTAVAMADSQIVVRQGKSLTLWPSAPACRCAA